MKLNDQIDFLLYEKGESFSCNNLPQRGLFVEATDKIAYYDDKILLTPIPFETGSVIQYQSHIWLVISQVDVNNDADIKTYKARIRKCSNRIAFNWSGNIKWFDCIEESKVFDIASNQYVSLPTASINIFVQNNPDTKNIDIGQRFYVTNQPFEVKGVDKTQEGLIKLNCDMVLINIYDDVENNIADRWLYQINHVYTLALSNGDAANVLLNDTIQLNSIATDNGVAVDNPVVTFTSSDSNIVSVDNSGKVMGIALGQAIISAKLTYHEAISDSITITTVETFTHSYTIGITGSSTVKLNSSQSYVAHFYDNGTEVFDKLAVWTIRNQDGTTTVAYATITTSTGNSATIKGNSSNTYVNKYIVLKATLSDDETVFKEFTVQLKSLF